MRNAKASIQVCAQSLQARFALRKMLMRGQDLSHQQMEFVVKYLQQETSIHRLGWWQLLTHTEKLALAQEVTLKTIEKGKRVTILTRANNEANVVLRGRAECFLLESQQFKPVINNDGFVFGNLKITNTTYSDANPAGWAAEAPEMHLCPYQKVVLVGPADYLIVTANFTINGAVQKVANVTKNHGLARYGLDALSPFARLHTYDAGCHIVRQGDAKSYLYFITSGACKASYKDPSVVDGPDDRSFALANANGVDVALLGPQSYIGDIACLFDLPEPVTVTCLSDVDVVYFNLQELYDVLKTSDDLKRRLVVVAHQTLAFVLERMGFLLGDKWTTESPSFNELQTFLSHHTLPYLPPYEDEAKRPLSAAKSSGNNNRSETPSALDTTPRSAMLAQFQHVNMAAVEPIEPTRDMLVAMHSMHSTFRTKSLASHGYALVHPSAPAIHSSELPLKTAQHKAHFLFPTMTKQRQYHGRTLPLIEKCQSLETLYLHTPAKL
ncbi:hypothetical protein SDRG_02715 [Saprolegnia diclina VS20]|uniref:Cyclic nucleotide-binding domain-containing protein n=1 Tax=Saprolegnia diclina (strain VS20) TaxID=1156394 RepID=T0R184_SAPDV|nr:hypothetical protein SDRG_02715 [Saprolegnia diclina VS20]EQC40060.1 hypothetical protein SDRG_02715 [Saprolegnia diclina VS20]|eukprot:XP_008606534.1 hypothetical protein SDRG_02715 [Saprolegnia diclina VS20]